MRLIILESPYGSLHKTIVEANVAYARACMRHSLLMGDNPFASHLLYTQPGVLDDNVPHERELGICAGLEWGRLAHATVVYLDRGLTSGMMRGIKGARQVSRPVEFRALYSDVGLLMPLNMMQETT